MAEVNGATPGGMVAGSPAADSQKIARAMPSGKVGLGLPAAIQVPRLSAVSTALPTGTRGAICT